SPTDGNLAELWDNCNNMVISWIMRPVNESIARSIMFIGTASEIWQQLEKSFSEELDSLNTLPVIARITPETTAFFNALSKQKEDQRLFQFLNGLEECYIHQRSQILMNPLPNVESACSLIQQKESQRVLFGSSSNVEITALYSRGNVKDKCGISGSSGIHQRNVGRKLEDSQCVVSFYPKFCVVQDLTTRKVKGLVSTQFEKQVKVVRSDNALEFVKGQCGSYLSSQVDSINSFLTPIPTTFPCHYKSTTDCDEFSLHNTRVTADNIPIQTPPIVEPEPTQTSQSNTEVPNTQSSTTIPSRKSTRTTTLPIN
nr:hypothetical protein [Tanacetum cinerariifolium]